MLQGGTKIFAFGHISIPILLLQYYLLKIPQPELLTLCFISLVWTLYLTWFSIFKNNLVGIYRMKSWFWFIVIDSALICAIYTLPDWTDIASPIWLLLFLSPLYAAEAGTKPTIYFSLIGLVNIFLFNVVQGGAFLSTDTFVVVMGMLIFILFIGRVSDNLYHMAYYDTLTSLPNRTLFKNFVIHSIMEAQRNKRRAAVIFLDLDQFKYVNDTMGHAIGDLLLKAVAKTIKQAAPFNAVFAR
ncbi:MAG TPA: GGDEF domain-containing protein, partial [Bacilli bacterium]